MPSFLCSGVGVSGEAYRGLVAGGLICVQRWDVWGSVNSGLCCGGGINRESMVELIEGRVLRDSREGKFSLGSRGSSDISCCFCQGWCHAGHP